MLAEVLPVLVRSFAAVYRAECAQNSVGQDRTRLNAVFGLLRVGFVDRLSGG